MRREDHVVAPQSVGDERLALEHVERRAGEEASFQRVDERRFLHDRAARGID